MMARSMTFRSSRMVPSSRTAEVDFPRRASHCFVDKLLEELREGIRALSGR
jgi:hypothetical protein